MGKAATHQGATPVRLGKPEIYNGRGIRQEATAIGRRKKGRVESGPAA